MSSRASDARIKALYDAGIVPYSISKLNAIDGCLKEAFYTYKLGIRDKGKQNIYGIMGSQIHDVLEKIYNNEATQADLLPALQNELADAGMVGVDFPKDFRGGTTIKDNWVCAMQDFCNNFQKFEGQFKTEELVILKISESRYLIGYIDLIQIVDEENKTVNIFDFKTSSKFKKEDLLHHGRQLIVYGMAMEQAGYKVLSLAWIMVKYIKVSYMGYARANSKNKTLMNKVILRGKLSKELSPIIERMMRENGYRDVDIEVTLDNFSRTNNIDSLPENIASNFTIEQYIEYYDYTDERKQEALEYINSRADKFEALWEQDEQAWTSVEITQKESFYCNNLCAYRDYCPEIKKYNDLLDLKEVPDEELF